MPMILAWLANLDEGMTDWGVSAAALKAGRWDTLFWHMFAHGGLLHIAMNGAVLVGLSGPLTALMGRFPVSWMRYFAFFFASGLAGAAMFVAINPNGAIPAIGASGAISGLVGLLSRLSGQPGRLVPVFSAEMRERVWGFVKANLLLIVIITVPIFLLGGEGGIAWEAHLGGYLLGLFAAPLLLVGPARRRAA